MKKRIVSVDFDGVIIEKLWGRDWTSQAKSEKGRSSALVRYIDKTWRKINHYWRKPVEGSLEGLSKFKKLGYKIVLVTSRKGYNREATMDWIKRWGYFELYDDYHFNNKEIGGAESKVENVGVAGPNVHIDDNWETVLALAKNYPRMEVWYLNPSPLRGPPLDPPRRAGRGSLTNIREFGGWKQMVEKLR